MIKADFFKTEEKGIVKCFLCSHYCRIAPGKTGACHVRKNISGILYSLNSDKVIATSADPIEKKPLYHFLPSTISYSIAAMGCNFSCDFCQNHSISMVEQNDAIPGKNIPAKKIVENAILSGAESIAFTYTEPTVYYELMNNVAVLSRENGLKNIMVSNGYLSEELILDLSKKIDGINVDLKAFSDKFYHSYCGGSLPPVLNTIRKMYELGIHVELTTLLINGKNDGLEEIKQLIDFILTINPDIPWHISRFYPSYKFNRDQPTNIESIYKIVKLGKKMGLNYIYSGNIQNNTYSDTLCPACNSILIKRSGYETQIVGLENGKCTFCQKNIAGIWV